MPSDYVFGSKLRADAGQTECRNTVSCSSSVHLIVRCFWAPQSRTETQKKQRDFAKPCFLWYFQVTSNDWEMIIGSVTKMRRSISAVIFALALATPPALYACAVCTELPETTISDQILAADVVVFAGPTPDEPFRYSPQRVFSGSDEKLGNAPKIPFLIDSVTRRSFQSDPTTTVLLTYGPEISDKAGRGFSRAWRRVFVMNSARTKFLERLQTNGPLWGFGETDNAARVSFFADYLWHPDQALHNTALMEIGRAPYALVRPIGGGFSTSRILEELNDLNRFAYWPVAIRLLGLQTDPEARSVVRARFARSLKSGGLHSHEWALAGIEVDTDFAIGEIGLALKDRSKSQDDKKALVRALSEAGSTHTQFQDEIVQVFVEVLDSDPELTLQIAVATRNWGETALHQRFEALAALEQTDAATQFFLNLVLQGEGAIE